MRFCIEFSVRARPSSSRRKGGKKYGIGRCVKGGNSEDRRARARLPSKLSDSRLYRKKTLLDSVSVSAARSSRLHDMRDAANTFLPTYF